MSDYIDQVFGAGGVLARNLPRYEPRSGQLELARAVDAAFVGPHHLLAEAPTGTGKSLAYSVPAAWHASKGTFSRVVVSTANSILPVGVVGMNLVIINTSATAAKLWPQSGSAINGGTASHACTVPASATMLATYTAASTWYVSYLTGATVV